MGAPEAFPRRVRGNKQSDIGGENMVDQSKLITAALYNYIGRETAENGVGEVVMSDSTIESIADKYYIEVHRDYENKEYALRIKSFDAEEE
jgi:hypothetical protein